MPAYKQVPVERLHELLEADFEAGFLTWRFREDVGHGNRTFNGKFAGKKAGNKTPHGYFAVQIDTVHLLVHRVIWAMKYGNWPSAQLDHINHQRSDNRICNLREVYHAENLRNQSPNSKNKSGVNGVFWSHKSQKWHAQIKTGGVCYYLGLFDYLEDAKQARLAANKRFGFHQNHGAEPAEPKPREKFTIQELILDTLIQRREGLNAEEISRLLVMNKRVIQNALSILKNEGQVRGERFPGALKAGLHWFATASAMPAKEQHHGISDFYPTVIDIQKVTATAFQSSFRAIMSESRSPSVVRARFAAIYLAEKLKKLSTTDLARRFARQDHTTVIHALKRAREFIRLETDFAAKVDAAEAELAQGRK